MAELKTRPNDLEVAAFLNDIPNEQQRQDAFTILDLMRNATGAEPKMWSSSIIGFGTSHYSYASGRSGDWFQAGFAPRKQNMTLYIVGGLDQHKERLQRLGKHSLGKGCLYIKRLADVDLATLQEIVAESVALAPPADA